MRRGVWHQCGDRSQKLVLEQLQLGNGAGVIISPRDLSFANASTYATYYRDLGAEIIVDLQFYNPQFHNDLVTTYPTNEYRVSITDLLQINDSQLHGFADSLRIINGSIGSTALLAPALIYEAGRNDIVDLNSRLFSIAKKVGDDLGIPTYATVLLGRSASISDSTITTLLSCATALKCDGWYFGFEFNQRRIPSNYDDVLKFGSTLLSLVSSGLPVLHAFAGPMSLVSLGFGATSAAIGHSQNLWQFTRGRWEISSSPQGGGGDAPPRYYSRNLWGTIVYPDELIQLPPELREVILTPTPFSSRIDGYTPIPWSRWDANKHLLYIIGKTIELQSQQPTAIENAAFAIELLNKAIILAKEITDFGLVLKDDASCYQENWKSALENGMISFKDDYEYISLL